jgi:NADPH:quinone reductase-like Zn-dependent oxidoreductase
VTGAAGAVGGFAVQLAQRLGWHVTGSDQPGDEQFVLGELGAEDYLPAGSKISRQYDAVLDTAALGDAVVDAVKDGGTFVTTRGDFAPTAQRGIRIRVTSIGADAARLTWLSDLAAAGDLTLRVAGTYPVDQAREAHTRLAQGKLRGRLVLTFDN